MNGRLVTDDMQRPFFAFDIDVQIVHVVGATLII